MTFHCATSVISTSDCLCDERTLMRSGLASEARLALTCQEPHSRTSCSHGSFEAVTPGEMDALRCCCPDEPSTSKVAGLVRAVGQSEILSSSQMMSLLPGAIVTAFLPSNGLP